MHVRVLAFAAVREIVGAPALGIDLGDGADLAALWRELVARFPALAPLGDSTRLARNGALATAGTRLHDGDEVAVLPPFGGG